MSDYADLVRKMSAAGASAEAIAIALEALQGSDAEVERRRASDRERKAKQRGLEREKRRAEESSHGTVTGQSRDKTVTNCDNSEPLARVVYTSLPSLHSEEVSTSEPNGSSVDDVERESVTVTPEKPIPKPKRGTRLPDDWEPSEADVAVARAEGLTDEEIFRAAREFRNFWTSRAGSAATKLSWSRTWENRVSEVADRLRRNGPRLVASTGQPGGNRRGAVSFADIFVERHGLAAERKPVPAGR